MPSSVPADVLASIANGEYLPTYTPPAGYQSLSHFSSATLSSVATPYAAISAQVYQGSNNQFVIAFEGTNIGSSIGSAQLFADQQILTGVLGTQIDPLSQASAYLSQVIQAISDQYPGATFAVTGHSLGGSEADYAVEQMEGGSQLPVSDAQISVVWRPILQVTF